MEQDTEAVRLWTSVWEVLGSNLVRFLPFRDLTLRHSNSFLIPSHSFLPSFIYQKLYGPSVGAWPITQFPNPAYRLMDPLDGGSVCRKATICTRDERS
jgi:hypothetical protein